MDTQQLFEILKKAQEPKGYFFSNDREKVFELLQGCWSTKIGTATWSALAAWPRAAVKKTGISSARVSIAPRMLKNTAPATATCMSQRNGTKAKLTAGTCPREDRLKKCFYEPFSEPVSFSSPKVWAAAAFTEFESHPPIRRV
jgi:hypothetical protein